MESIAGAVLPDHVFNFSTRIDLMDESLREGAERATVPPSLEQKIQLGEAIAATGIKTLVVGMFPDVPHNVALLAGLLASQDKGAIPADVRFMVISHVGVTFEQTVALLEHQQLDRSSVWIIAIHSVSDMQIEHLFPTILRKDPTLDWQQSVWEGLSVQHRRERNIEWLAGFVPRVRQFKGGGIMFGLLDTFRADIDHLERVVQVLANQGVTQVRLVDTAGSCLPEQIPSTVGRLLQAFPGIDFFGHFHDDFGMATANAIRGLSLGLKGVDVSVGGFANRAGHPPLAEVTMALKSLYGITLAGFNYAGLYALSRATEKTYGLLENPAQAITGVITHAVQSGIRTELLKKAPRIFDIIEPAEIGGHLVKMFGVRSGKDGLFRFLKERQLHISRTFGVEVSQALADSMFETIDSAWKARSSVINQRIQDSLSSYHAALAESFFTEAAVMDSIEQYFVNLQGREMDVRMFNTETLWEAFNHLPADATPAQWEALLGMAQQTLDIAFEGEQDAVSRQAQTCIHRVLYWIYAHRINSPMNASWKDCDSYQYDRLRQLLESRWEAFQGQQLKPLLGNLPTAANFEAWSNSVCQAHRSNVSHPLFDFLKNQASFAQLREFISQETPFDIHFGDILAMMLPGVYGGAKAEFSKNFWDEMGHGEVPRAHRQMRLEMTSAIDVDPDAYLHNIEMFCLEELRLANMYFKGAFNRSKLFQAIGMMLATELMVPGRLEQQIQGWRRVGLEDSTMAYLLEHTVVDVEHAAGWLNEVVLPLVQQRPQAIHDIAFGMLQRLEYAADVCDHMLVHLQHVSQPASSEAVPG
ncbi:iron-containing redox enzyme family protein [Pseudomonas fontis]|uniref:Iron-containing redox enzyme family protein n=1 Tax=Pseudomonas fontis TaxID=2942633 RepID=A0ABT5NRG5_9PSED|nr:iron-containing redox enzyme family protein [Pseudomonas fontis]MDD0976653.1 iron-containing redox enzyme family protein [Pseudomonas fontis]MDD0990765.1 iron-containing redox enzyme family protein [Pseudomonas fontis]